MDFAFHGFYLVWLLLPLAFLFLSGWACIKHVWKIPGREYLSEHSQQLLFCTLALLVAVLIDQWLSDDFLFEISLDMVDEDNSWLPRLLTYPIVLVVLSYAQKLIRGEGKDRVWRPRQVV